MSAEAVTLIVLALGSGLLLGALLTYLILHTRQRQLEQQHSALSATLEAERRANDDKLSLLEQSRQQLGESFKALSGDALRHNNEAFLSLAREQLKQLHLQAEGELSKKEKGFEALITPIREALEKTERQMRQMENERKEAQGAIYKHLESVVQTQQGLQQETRRLVDALRRPEVRGQWGEMTLRRLAELAGMVDHCDFFEQESLQTDAGTLRPDMVVRLPGGRELVIDAKTPLDAYLSAIEAASDEQRTAELVRHARKVRERVRELASKSYWSQFKHSPDFVVLFIPGEQFLSSALDQDRELLEYAMQQRVILATPTTLVALLRAVAYGWRQEALAENAEQIRHLGAELYERLAVFADHLGKLGKSLDNGVKHYNAAVGSFDSRVLSSARKFTEMGIHAKKPIEQPEQVEKGARSLDSGS